MGVEKHLRDLQIVNLAMQGVKLGRIAKQVGLHRNTIAKILRKPETQQLLTTLRQELAQRVTPHMIERHEAARQAA